LLDEKCVRLLFSTLAFCAIAQSYPTPKPGNWTAKDFRFHTGEVMPELKIGYTTVGEPTAEPVVILHYIARPAPAC